MARAGFRKPKSKMELEEVETSTDKPSLYARRQHLDPLTERLGEKGFYHRMRWPWLVIHYGGLDHPLEVSRFYKDQNLAVDIGNVDPMTAEHKQKLFDKHEIKYVILRSAMDFNTLSGAL